MYPSPAGHDPDLSIIIVNWNVQDLLRRCLASIAGSDGLHILAGPLAEIDGCVQNELRSQHPQMRLWRDDVLETTPHVGVLSPQIQLSLNAPKIDERQSDHGGIAPTAEVIVVDNASSDDSVAMLAREAPWVRLIANERNLGFTRANNQGLAISRGRYLLFLNPDTEVAPGALTLMLAYAEAHPAVGVVGPELRYADGSHQSSRRRFPSLATFFLESTVIQRWWPRNRVLSRYYVLDRPDDAISRVDWIVGACMLVRRAVLEQIGGFDEGFFMYSEELDLCRRAVLAGWQVVYYPPALVMHYEGKSSEQGVAARHIRYHSSRIRYVRKYHGGAAAAMLRGFLLLTFIWQWGEEALKWLAGGLIAGQRGKRPMRRERMAAYCQVLRSGLRPIDSI